MDISTLKARESEKGFTLVELAVVMIIIGLLIGGILKGQELITNARVTTTASQIESMGAAYNGFRDQFNAIPGDMGNAVARISDCATVVACANAPAGTAGNGVINTDLGAASAGEGLLFFSQMLAAGLISGLDGSAAAAGFGITNPTAPIGGGFTASDTRNSAARSIFTQSNVRGAPHVALVGTTAALAANTGPATPGQAANIDRRIDDGSPTTGSLIGEDGCNVGGAGTAYNEANPALACALAYRM